MGIDIWAAEGTPVIATVSGTVVQAVRAPDPGNQVRIRDACGWSHYSIHLKSIAPGIVRGRAIRAGTVIGYVGKTGRLSGGAVHLHYAIYPGEEECRSTNPWSYLKAVEYTVCYVPQACGYRDCGVLQLRALHRSSGSDEPSPCPATY